MTMPITQVRSVKLDERIENLISNVYGTKILKKVQIISNKIEVFHIEFEVAWRKWVWYIVCKETSHHLPGLVYCRWGSGDFGKLNIAQVFSILWPMSSKWYVIFAPQYAGNGGSEWRDEIGWQDLEDVVIAPEIFQSFLGYKPSNIGIFAESRGAIMAYKTLEKVDWVYAMVIRGWITNLWRWISLRPELEEAWKDRFPQTPESYNERSALCWPEKLAKNIPILLMHGMCDWRVSPLDSIELSMRFLELGIPHRLVCFEWSDHGLSEVKDEAFRLTINWFNTYVKLRKKPPSIKLHGK